MFIQIGRLITLRDTGRAIELKLWFLLKLESNYGNFCNATCCGLQKGCLATAPCPVFVYIGIAMERTHDAGLCYALYPGAIWLAWPLRGIIRSAIDDARNNANVTYIFNSELYIFLE
jgi:hypothetical protein